MVTCATSPKLTSPRARPREKLPRLESRSSTFYKTYAFPHNHPTTSLTCANMSDPSDESTRPAKRARLDDNAAPSLSTTSTAAPIPTASILSAPATIDTDLEREVRAGITEYVCPDNLGFRGVLKQRYTDFLVNEIGLGGEVLHLKSTEVVDKKKAGKEDVEKTNGAAEKKPEGTAATEGKVDAVMQDAGVVGETTLAVPEPAKAEDAPKESENDGEQIIGKPAAAQEEPEEQVRGFYAYVLRGC